MINILKQIGIILKTQLISLKFLASSVRSLLSLDDGDTMTNQYYIANNCNKYLLL